MQQRSLIQLLLHATNETETSPNSTSRNSLSYEELREEAKLFIIAGHETTSTWCHWVLYCLAKYDSNNNYQQKVYNNIIENVESTKSFITLDDISKMDYFIAYMNECIRLYPPAALIFRYTSGEEEWNNCKIPPMTRLCIPIFLLHRHPKYW